MIKVNDQKYWNERFAIGDWEKYGGDEQAAFFADLAMNAFPEWLTKEMHEEALSIRDYGCARGSGTALLAKHFPTCLFTGIDFSEEAIAFAKEQYGYCEFEVGDLYTMELPPCDMVFSSNTLEHLREPKSMLRKLVQSAQKYAVILLPLDDTTDHCEHFFKFDVDFFPEKIGQMMLGYFHIIDCRDGSSPYWNGKQILLVYVHQGQEKCLENMIGEISKKGILPRMDAILALRAELTKLKAQLEEAEHARQIETETVKENYNQEIKQLQDAAQQVKQQMIAQNEQQIKDVSDGYEHEISHLHESFKKQIEDLNALHLHDQEEVIAAAEQEKKQLMQKNEQIRQDAKQQITELCEAHDRAIQAMQREAELEKQVLALQKAETEVLRESYEKEKADLRASYKEKLEAYDENNKLILQQAMEKEKQYKNEANQIISRTKKNAEIVAREWRDKYDLLWQDSTNAVHTMKAQQDQVVSQWQDKCDQLSAQLQQEKDRADQNEQIIQQLNQRMAQIHENATRIIAQGKALSGNRSFKIVHFLNRWRIQYQQGNRMEKNAFKAWFRSHLKGEVSFDTTYNPLYQLLDPLHSVQSMAFGIEAPHSIPKLPLAAEPGPVGVANVSTSYTYPAWFLGSTYQAYDVIVFGVINYDFRYQRPQQIADHFVREGHRVFYINANFTKNGGAEVTKNGNLFQVSLSSKNNFAVYSLNKPDDCAEVYSQLDQLMVEYGIRDALMIADYPTWIDSIIRLKQRYGFNLVTDYMDDFTGFLTTTEPFVKDCCLQLLKESHAIVASSQYLVDVASKYNNHVFPIRNGTEYEHFHSVFGKKNLKKRKIIGYYGAIAEWFDAEKVEYLAKRFSDCDIVLIGDITNERVKACTLPNVKKLGEKPYRDLPEMLADFDVCLIPFDTSTDLIKATNPVKFYEYLSAGKKIVATEIPELEPFRNKYVYLANKNKEFGDYVEMCLNNSDKLADAEKCAAFALENDWSERVKAFEKVATQTFPRVSIIVLCYNQLDYTRQCVESILNNTAYPNYELILVDNNSTDDTAAYLQDLDEKYQQVKIVLNKTNRGFAGGNNDGIDASNGEYLILLNNDTLVTRGWMTNMVKHCRANAKVGIVGAVTNSIGNEAQIPVEYTEIDDMPAFAYGYTAAHMNETYPHDGVLAMYCVMFSRHLVDMIGKLDENYGIGMFEDDDYSVAASRAGFDLILPEDVFIHHFGSVSFKKLEDEKHRMLFEKNKAYFERKWHTSWHMHHYRNQ